MMQEKRSRDIYSRCLLIFRCLIKKRRLCIFDIRDIYTPRWCVHMSLDSGLGNKAFLWVKIDGRKAWGK